MCNVFLTISARRPGRRDINTGRKIQRKERASMFEQLPEVVLDGYTEDEDGEWYEEAGGQEDPLLSDG